MASATVTQGITFTSSEVLTPAKLNLMANPTVTIAEDSITISELDETLFDPTLQELTGATPTWTVIADRADQLAKIAMTGNTTISFSGLTAGMWGILIMTNNGGGAHTVTLPAGSVVASAGGGSVTTTATTGAKDTIVFYYDGTTITWTPGYNYT